MVSLPPAPSTFPPVFKVSRQEPQLLAPAKPTPHEIKQVSDIDDQDDLRFQLPVIQFYPNNPSMRGKDPAKVIREALSEALVYYYPFAGRLREGPNHKLSVDCTGEGVIFIEADADVTLDQFGDELHPPFPCREELLYNVPGSDGILHCPLLLIQVTRLKCGGFILAVRLNHIMSDSSGLVQFLNAVAELAQGEPAPSITPVWQREVFNARDPPQITCTHYAYEQMVETDVKINQLISYRCFVFGPNEISALRMSMPPDYRSSSRLELVAACMWHCRTIALQLKPHEDVRLTLVVDVRAKFKQVSRGYYGNGVCLSTVLTTVEKLSQNPLAYAVKLVKELKEQVTEEYVRSMIDLLASKDRPRINFVRYFGVSDITRVGFTEVDYGWGKAVYGGTADGVYDEVSSMFLPFTNKKGENGILAPMNLPSQAMDIFVQELNSLLWKPITSAS